jgi:hypothetical protein
VICEILAEFGQPTGQPHGIIVIGRKYTGKAENIIKMGDHKGVHF